MRLLRLLLAAIAWAPPAAAGDWPQILGPARDGHAVDERIEPWSGDPKVRWRFPCGAGYAGVAVADGRVFLWHRVEREEVLNCLDAATGDPLWRVSFPAIYRGGVDPDTGPRCVPVVSADRVLVYGAAGDLHAVSVADGRKIWSRQLGSDYAGSEGYFGFGSTPLVAGSVVIVAVGGQPDAGLVAVNLQDGATRWTAIDSEAAYASPVPMRLGNRELVAAVMRMKTVVVDPETGAVVRQFDFGRRGPTVNAATPLVDGPVLFVTAAYGVGCRKMDMSVDPPRDLWTDREVISSQYASPVRVGDALYSTSGREDLGNAGLVCVDWTSGQLLWSRPEFGTAHLIVVGDRILAQRVSGRLDLLAADPQSFRSLASSPLPSGAYRSLPALAGGILYCRRTETANSGELIAIEL